MPTIRLENTKLGSITETEALFLHPTDSENEEEMSIASESNSKDMVIRFIH